MEAGINRNAINSGAKVYGAKNIKETIKVPCHLRCSEKVEGWFVSIFGFGKSISNILLILFIINGLIDF